MVGLSIVALAGLCALALIGLLAILLVSLPFIMAALGGFYCAHTTAYIAGCP
jgi:hypothetical protein